MASYLDFCREALKRAIKKSDNPLPLIEALIKLETTPAVEELKLLRAELSKLTNRIEMIEAKKQLLGHIKDPFPFVGSS